MYKRQHNQVALGKGDGTFTLLPVLSNQVNAIADFNSDDRPDVFVTCYCGATQIQFSGVMLGNGDGTFGALVNVPTPTIGVVESNAVADMNGDGRPDIVFPWADAALTSVVPGVGVLLNTTSPTYELSASPASATVSAGQSAKFSLVVAPSGSFRGTVNLGCAITPVVTSAPTCALSSSSVQISGSASPPVTVTVATTAPVTTGTVSQVNFPPGAMPFAWTAMVLGLGWLWLRTRRRLLGLAASVTLLALASLIACGGSGAPSSHTIPGTPAGTYSATITASSGGLNHNMTLTVVVQ